MIGGSVDKVLYPLERGLSIHAIQLELSKEIKRYELNIDLMSSVELTEAQISSVVDKQKEITLLFKKSIDGLNSVNKAIQYFDRKETLRCLNEEFELLLKA